MFSGSQGKQYAMVMKECYAAQLVKKMPLKKKRMRLQAIAEYEP